MYKLLFFFFFCFYSITIQRCLPFVSHLKSILDFELVLPSEPVILYLFCSIRRALFVVGPNVHRHYHNDRQHLRPDLKEICYRANAYRWHNETKHINLPTDYRPSDCAVPDKRMPQISNRQNVDFYSKTAKRNCNSNRVIKGHLQCSSLDNESYTECCIHHIMHRIAN